MAALEDAWADVLLASARAPNAALLYSPPLNAARAPLDPLPRMIYA